MLQKASRAKSSWEDVRNVNKIIPSRGFYSKVKIAAWRLFATSPYFCWQLTFYRHLPTLGRQNSIQKIFYPPFIYIFWILNLKLKDSLVACPKQFPVENFWVQSDLRKFSVFTNLCVRTRFFLSACCGLNFDPQKLTWCQQFGLQIFLKLGDAHICPQKNAVFRCFFLLNRFSCQTVDLLYFLQHLRL